MATAGRSYVRTRTASHRPYQEHASTLHTTSSPSLLPTEIINRSRSRSHPEHKRSHHTQIHLQSVGERYQTNHDLIRSPSTQEQRIKTRKPQHQRLHLSGHPEPNYQPPTPSQTKATDAGDAELRKPPPPVTRAGDGRAV